MQSLILIGVIVLALCLLVVGILSTWKKIPSDKAAIIVGMGKPKVVTGGGVWVVPVIQRMDSITLENVMFNVEVKKTKTSLGVPINAEGVVVLKVKNDERSILNAVQQFNNDDATKTIQNIRNQATEVCKGKLREIVSSMSVENIYNNRETFAQKVQEVVGSELGEMGLELKSFTINDISDDDGYIVALGKEQIAIVKSQAAIAEAKANKEMEISIAESNKEKKIKKAEAEKLGRKSELEAETVIREAEKDKEIKVLEYKKEQDKQRAIADSAYKIQESITSKDVTNATMDNAILENQRLQEVTEAQVNIEIMKEERNIELAKKKAQRKEAELEETVIKPAEAELRRGKLEAELEKYQQIQQAEAEAQKIELEGNAHAETIKAVGFAEAETLRQKGLAEAEALEKKAEALAKMDEAGKLQMVIERLPEIARAVSEPLSKIGNITIIGGGSGKDGGNGATEVARYAVEGLKAVTEAVKETIGFDLTEVMKVNTIQAKTDRNFNITTEDRSLLAEVIGREHKQEEVKEVIETEEVKEDKETSI